MSTRASAWPRSANISGNKQKTSLFRSEKGKAPGRALFLFAPGAQNFFAAKRPGLFFAPRGRRRFVPKGKCSQPPFSFRRRSRHGPSGPRRKCGVRRRESVGQAAGVYSIKRGPAALCAAGNKRERAAGEVQEGTRQGDNRGISAEMQCGTASRAARDLTGEPCSPVNPFFLDGGFWLGESAPRKPGGGVGGAFYASGGTGGFVTPDDFSLVPPGGTISF